MRWVWVLVVGGLLAGAATGAVAGAGPGGDAVQSAGLGGDLVPSAGPGGDPVASGGTGPTLGSADEPSNATLPGDDSEVSVGVNGTYAPGEDVAVTVSGTEAQLYAVYLYDSNGSRVAVKRPALASDTQTLSFGSLDAGSYRVVVVEAYTGAQATAAFGVGGAYEPGVVPEVTVDQPADVVTVDVSLPNGTTRATVDIADRVGEYRVTATVVDRDGDGVVTLDWNTFYAGRDDVSLSASGNDTVENATRERDLTGFLPEREYHVTVSANDRVLDRGAVVVHLEPLHSVRMNVYEAPATGSPEESFEQAVSSSDVETDEWTFVVVHVEGVFGAISDVDDLRSVGPDQAVLVIEPLDGSEPVRLTAADYVHVEEGRIVVGFGPGNEALVAGTDYEVAFRISSAHPYRGGSEETRQRISIVPAGSEPDYPVVAVERVEAPDSVAAGDPANFTVTLLNAGERDGTISVSVSIGAKTVERDVTVPGNDVRTVEIAVDTDGILSGNRQYVVRANESRETGSIVIGNASDGPTLVDGDREESGLPGFTVPGAVAALLAVGLLARYRSGARD